MPVSLFTAAGTGGTQAERTLPPSLAGFVIVLGSLVHFAASAATRERRTLSRSSAVVQFKQHVCLGHRRIAISTDSPVGQASGNLASPSVVATQPDVKSTSHEGDEKGKMDGGRRTEQPSRAKRVKQTYEGASTSIADVEARSLKERWLSDVTGVGAN